VNWLTTELKFYGRVTEPSFIASINMNTAEKIVRLKAEIEGYRNDLAAAYQRGEERTPATHHHQ
jgi:hypothetical protein